MPIIVLAYSFIKEPFFR